MTNPEDVVNQASGGAARRGIYLAGDDTTVSVKIPPKLLLQPFVLVDFLLPASQGSRKKYTYFRAEQTATFEKTCESCGFAASVSMNFEGWGVAAASAVESDSTATHVGTL